jgi:hypothetical protein
MIEAVRKSERGLCIECAVRHHDVSQTNRPCVGGTDSLEMSSADAWIDGRCHVMLPSLGRSMRCKECDRVASCLYVPTE